jgi:hypothetical protein
MSTDITTLGKLLVGIGLLIVLVGGVFWLSGRVPFLGRLPGDISLQRGNFSCYLPLATMILLSILLTVLLNVVIQIILPLIRRGPR